MTLRSIDMQVLLPKISEANRSQPIQDQQNQTQQQQFAAQFQKQAEIQQHQVQTSNKSEGSLIGKESGKKEHAGQQDRKGSKDQDGNEADGDVRDPARGNLLDIKI